MSEQADWRGTKLIIIISVTVFALMMGSLITWFWSKPDTQPETAPPPVVQTSWVKERISDAEDASRSAERQDRIAERIEARQKAREARQKARQERQERRQKRQEAREAQEAAQVATEPSQDVQVRSSGDLPELLLFIRSHESGGNYSAYNATGCEGFGCGGAFQLHAQYASAWAAEAGYSGMSSNAADWSPETQDAVALYKFNQTNGGLWCDWVDYC